MRLLRCMGKRLKIDFQAAFRWERQPESLLGGIVACQFVFRLLLAVSRIRQPEIVMQ